MSLLSGLFKNDKVTAAGSVKTALDLVTYAGGLASNPADIDPLLDEVRKITALHPVSEGISSEDEQRMLRVYMGLEDYLTTRDPIRTYTKSELRSHIDQDLLGRLNTYETKGDQ